MLAVALVPSKHSGQVRILSLVPNPRSRGVVWPNIPPCHGEDRQFKSGRDRQTYGSRLIGRTHDSESCNLGSNPSNRAKQDLDRNVVPTRGTCFCGRVGQGTGLKPRICRFESDWKHQIRNGWNVTPNRRQSGGIAGVTPCTLHSRWKLCKLVKQCDFESCVCRFDSYTSSQT